MGQNQWYHFLEGAPPILEPILVVGLGCSLRVRFGFCPEAIYACMNLGSTSAFTGHRSCLPALSEAGADAALLPAATVTEKAGGGSAGLFVDPSRGAMGGAILQFRPHRGFLKQNTNV